jgi:hypothetical protein
MTSETVSVVFGSMFVFSCYSLGALSKSLPQTLKIILLWVSAALILLTALISGSIYPIPVIFLGLGLLFFFIGRWERTADEKRGFRYPFQDRSE